MSVYRELRTDPSMLPIEIAQASLEQSTRALTRPFGQAIVNNGAGGTSIIGGGSGDGLTPWVDDTEAPSRPTGLSADNFAQVVTVHWDGTLEYGLPADFHSIEVHIRVEDGEDTVIGELRVAGDVATGVMSEGTIVDVWAVALDYAHNSVGDWTPNRSEPSEIITVVVEPIVSQEQLAESADNILAAADESVKAQIDKVNTTITEAQQQIEANREGIEDEAYLREEGDKRAQEAAAAVKAETDKLATKYDEMDTSVTNVKNDLKNVMTSTTQLEQDMIVSTLVEYAVGDSDTTPPGVTTTDNSVSVLSDPWGPDTPERTPGTYIWMRTRVTFGDGRQETSAPVLVTGNTGAQGPQGPQGVAGAQGVSVSALTPFWQLAESKPAQPVNKSPGGGWTSTEPTYVRGKKLWTCSRIEYSNGQWSWTSVQQSSAFEAAELALTTANGKNRRYVQPATPVVDASELTQGDEWWQTSSKPPETYWMGEPNNSVSVLVDHSNEVEHIWVWNGKRWALNRLSAEDIIVSGSVAAGLVTADFFDGARIRGGEFVTSNELIRLNNAGLVMDGKSGERLVTLNAIDGAATFQHVSIINGSLSVPTIEGGSIEGADYKLTTGSGENKQIVARINSDGVTFGDHLSYAKNKQGEWVLSLKGAIQSGGEISGAAITGAAIRTNTEWQSSEAAKKYRGLVITDGGMYAYKNSGKEEYSMAFTASTGELKLDGAIASNAVFNAPTISAGEMVGTNIYTGTDADNRVSITSAGLTVTHGGQTVISFAADGAVDLGTSGIAADARVSDLTEEVHATYTPRVEYEATTGALSQTLTDVTVQIGEQSSRLDGEIQARSQYMRFDPDTGLTIGDLTAGDAYSVRLSATRMEFMAGNTTAAYVSNDRLYINNAEVVSTMRIGRFAFLPRENGHMSLQYVGDAATATNGEE